MRCRIPILCLLFVLIGSSLSAQTLNLPARSTNAPGGADFKEMILPLSFGSSSRQLSPREIAILGQVLQGNVPNWMRQMTLVNTNALINGTNHTVSYYVIPEYLAIGSEQDYFLMPMTPLLSQRIADALNCSLTTSKMVNDIWRKAPCKLSPSTKPPVPEMIDIPYYDEHNTAVRGQRFAVTNTYPLGILTGGDKKDVIISSKIYTNFSTSITKVVVIYGWQQSNGTPIQPVYNGHEETYADYSHGIRLVQMGLTVDGQANSVSNVLTNPNLAALLSDDPTYANNVIPTPRYSLPAMPPSITTQPFSETVAPNTTSTISAFAVGEKPIAFQWQRNGIKIAGATNATLTLPNVLATNAGVYTVIASNVAGSSVSIPAILHVSNPVHPLLFFDDFETNSSARWDLYWDAANAVPDYTVDWAFDYSHESYTFNGAGYFIPPAPNSGAASTRGIRLTVNNNDTNASTAAVNLYPKNKTFSNDFALKFDMWINYPGGIAGAGSSGSTEYALCGINHLGTQPNWAATSAPSTDGLWFAVDGEGGVANDYRAFVGANGTQLELTGAASGLSQSDNTASIYQNLFPSTRHETAGAPGKNWVEVELRQVGGIITWLMNGTIIAQRTNTSSFTSGKIMIGYMDTFSSIANPTNQSFILFDNVRVEDLGQTLSTAVITAPPQNAQVSVGSSAQFSVTATGSSLIYQWYFNNALISGATNNSLQLTNVQATDAGNYSVVVSNAASSASATVSLTVLAQPSQFNSISRDASGAAQIVFSGNSGVFYLLEASTNLSAWVPISVLPITNGPFPFLDLAASNIASRYYRTRSSSNYLLTDFESFTNGTTALFVRPATSGSTTNFLDLPAGDFCYVTNIFPAGHGGDKVLAAGWTFKSSTTNPWLRTTTFASPNLPNPVIGSNQAVQFDIYSNRDLYVALGLRETNPTGDFGSNGGATGTIEWVGGITENGTPPKGHFVSSNQWITVTVLLPYEPVKAFTGNGILTTSTGKFVLEHLAFVPVTNGLHNVFIDNVRLIELSP